ncbi:MAG: ABC transporter substrate-binding protein [Rhodobiaceae bacterium]|nr:ABC transporter substrate-binding protein [Rhodobiaceae bacterium]MCC0049955.1 ABC transporter substrate-binding protein [Rhodobiaceae bacterium]
MAQGDSRFRPNRREMLAGSAALAGAVAAGIVPARAEFGPPRHGISVFGELKYGLDFAHLDYVNVDAPKGGKLSRTPSVWAYNQNPTTFNTLNTLVQKGDAPVALDIIYDSLMRRALDEPDAVYGLAAERVAVSGDKRSYRFTMRPEARFHDGTPLTAEDAAFTLETLKAKGHALIRQTIRRMESAVAEDEKTLVVTLEDGTPVSLAMAIATLPILSKTFHESRDFEEAGLDIPLGSGPYRVGQFEAGRYIEYDRVEDYWARDLPINRGQHNFDTIRFEFFRDRDVAFEGFKGRAYNLREEFTSRVWATGYDFPAVKDGRVKLETLPDDRPSGAQGWFLNTRLKKLSDPRVREALINAFDFEWTNKTLFYGLYQRTWSYFQNSDMMAEGPPSPEELSLLELYRDRLPEEVFGEPYTPPVSDGSGRDRKLQRAAAKLLEEAGYEIRDGVRHTPDGDVFRIEFLDDEPTFDRVVQPYIQRLKALGIDARSRTVDASQFRKRIVDFDFDIVIQRFAIPATPGEEVRVYWTSDNADTPGSRNLSGIKSPVIDDLTQRLIDAQSRGEQVTVARALDRVLRAGRYWVPQWYKPVHTLAYWDVYAHPENKPRYDLGLNDTWWYDAAKAEENGLAG